VVKETETQVSIRPQIAQYYRTLGNLLGKPLPQAEDETQSTGQKAA
jgi:hypothetical protein